MGARIEFDTSMWPVIVITLAGELGDQDYDQLFEKFADVAGKGPHFVAITDVRQLANAANAMQRKRMAEKFKIMQQKGPRQLGSIVVAQSALIRGALTAMNWLTRINLTSARTLEEALSAARAILVEEGIPLPEALQERRLG